MVLWALLVLTVTCTFVAGGPCMQNLCPNATLRSVPPYVDWPALTGFTWLNDSTSRGWSLSYDTNNYTQGAPFPFPFPINKAPGTAMTLVVNETYYSFVPGHGDDENALFVYLPPAWSSVIVKPLQLGQPIATSCLARWPILLTLDRSGVYILATAFHDTSGPLWLHKYDLVTDELTRLSAWDFLNTTMCPSSYQLLHHPSQQGDFIVVDQTDTSYNSRIWVTSAEGRIISVSVSTDKSRRSTNSDFILLGETLYFFLDQVFSKLPVAALSKPVWDAIPLSQPLSNHYILTARSTNGRNVWFDERRNYFVSRWTYPRRPDYNQFQILTVDESGGVIWDFEIIGGPSFPGAIVY
eukprot:TRINITY_DN13442_c0_g1_i3.p1 TRINITY_DN13442_c0_g1~~TRINITY_DN13442_c0_g1_i3.p1  ORF type:complete len:353 (+),score=43.92 TRINITY_DN13442_c0_g1_i3:78-1136(+)